MLELTKRLETKDKEGEVLDTLTLPYELRIRGRLKATTDKGQEVGLFLDRGPVLNDGDLLESSCGKVIQVRAADEPVVTAYIENGLPLGKLCYHLGNRHVTLAIGSDSDDRYWVRFPPDHVLEELAELLGATLERHEAPFDPESGAYAQTGLGHSHAHGHEHSHHEHNHNEGHSHHGDHNHAH
ncbi:urease accessory protein UreE [Psychrobacter lutiphocae]|uniref:urease accessory protein UreE n=1 Tax=Psychrobacter lutiphocae TaxID=540500 RepID=UPI0003624CCB|nr:urease accessory protein UreE [Psychrobacter lutiphocae]